VERVKLVNVPSFAAILDADIAVPGIGTVRVDVGYGGAFFVIVDARAFGFKLLPGEARQLVETGELIKEAARRQLVVQHPEIGAFNKIAFTEFTLPISEEKGERTGRNTVVISPGKLDRSPCGTGTCARLAVMHAKGEIAAGEGFISRSVIDSRFEGKIESTTSLKDGTPAIVPSIAGRAWLTGIHSYFLDPEDPWPEGYTLSDTWYRALG
jgi:trans-L-3-hydroxyproline dehydratase